MVSTGFPDGLLYFNGSFDGFCDMMTMSMDKCCQGAYNAAYYWFVHEQKLITKKNRKPATMRENNFEYFQGLKWPAFSDHTIKEYFIISLIAHEAIITC
jgi:hypothetical protein